jgi:hypothetical protein
MIKLLSCYSDVQKVANSSSSALINFATLVCWSVTNIFDGTWVSTLWSYETCVLIDVLAIFYVTPYWGLSSLVLGAYVNFGMLAWFLCLLHFDVFIHMHCCTSFRYASWSTWRTWCEAKLEDGVGGSIPKIGGSDSARLGDARQAGFIWPTLTWVGSQASPGAL